MSPNRLVGPVQALGNGCSQDQGTCTHNETFKNIVVVVVLMVMTMVMASIRAMPAGACLDNSGKQACYEYGCCCKGNVFFHGVLLGLLFQAKSQPV